MDIWVDAMQCYILSLGRGNWVEETDILDYFVEKARLTEL